MLGQKRALLRVVLNKEFSKGINKVDLFNVLEDFIDKQYPDPQGGGQYFTHHSKTKILHELALDIHRAGGLKVWKKKLLLLTAPVIGLPLAKKKK